MRYWWVNHKQTCQEEIAGGFLWSPKTEKGGKFSQYYQNLRVASPGDGILSYANDFVSYIGNVEDFAFPSPRPKEFGRAGEVWANDGWLLPVSWQETRKEVRPRDIFDQFQSYLPMKYSPLNIRTGKGNQKAYLCEISTEIFSLFLEKSNSGSLRDFVGKSNLGLASNDRRHLINKQIENEIEVETGLENTTRKALIDARSGQGVFRKNVLSYGSQCVLTGVVDQWVLIASHIKPWRSCENSLERLDGNNGVLLAPHVDRLFDRGYISFENDGHVKKSHLLSTELINRLGLTRVLERTIVPFRGNQNKYLKYHRGKMFFLIDINKNDLINP